MMSTSISGVSMKMSSIAKYPKLVNIYLLEADGRTAGHAGTSFSENSSVQHLRRIIGGLLSLSRCVRTTKPPQHFCITARAFPGKHSCGTSVRPTYGLFDMGSPLLTRAPQTKHPALCFTHSPRRGGTWRKPSSRRPPGNAIELNSPQVVPDGVIPTKRRPPETDDSLQLPVCGHFPRRSGNVIYSLDPWVLAIWCLLMRTGPSASSARVPDKTVRVASSNIAFIRPPIAPRSHLGR